MIFLEDLELDMMGSSNVTDPSSKKKQQTLCWFSSLRKIWFKYSSKIKLWQGALQMGQAQVLK